MEAAIAWIAAHWMELLGVLFIVDKLAAAVVALTPTPADDRIYGKVYRLIIEPLAGIWGRRAKELPGEKMIRDTAKQVGEYTAAANAAALKKTVDRIDGLVRAKLHLGLLLALAVTAAALSGSTGAPVVQTNEADERRVGGQMNTVMARTGQPWRAGDTDGRTTRMGSHGRTGDDAAGE